MSEMTFPQMQLVRKMQKALRENLLGIVCAEVGDSQSACAHHVKKSSKCDTNLYSVTICAGCSGTGEPIHLGLFKDLESACLMNDGYELMCKRHFSLVCLSPSDIDWLGFFILKRYDPVANGFRPTELMSLLREYLPDMSEDIDSVSRRRKELKHLLNSSNEIIYPQSLRRMPNSSTKEADFIEIEDYCSSDSDNDDDSVVQSTALALTPMLSTVSSPSPLTVAARTSELIYHFATYFPSCTFTIDPINIATLPTTAFQAVPRSTLMASLMSLNMRPAAGEMPLALMNALTAGVLRKAMNHSISSGAIITSDPGIVTADTQIIENEGPCSSQSEPLCQQSASNSMTEMALSEFTIAGIAAALCTVFHDGRGYENALLNWKLKEICISSGLLPSALFESSPIDIDMLRNLAHHVQFDVDSTPTSETGDMLGGLSDSFCGRVNALMFPNDWQDASVTEFEKLLCELDGIPVIDGNAHQVLFPEKDKFSFTPSSRVDRINHPSTSTIEVEEPEDFVKLVEENIIASIIWNVFGPIISTANGFAVQSKTAGTLFTSLCVNQLETSIKRLDSSFIADERANQRSEAFTSLLLKHIAAAEDRYDLTTHVTWLLQHVVLISLKKTQKILHKRAALEFDVRRSKLLFALSLTKKIEDKLKMTVKVLCGAVYLWHNGSAIFRLSLFDILCDPSIIQASIDFEKIARRLTACCHDAVSDIAVDNNYVLEWACFNTLAIACYLEKGYAMIISMSDNPTCVPLDEVTSFLSDCESVAKRFIVANRAAGRLPLHADRMTPDTHAIMGCEFKMAALTEIMRYLMLVSGLQTWLSEFTEYDSPILSLFDTIPGDSYISVVFNGNRRHMTYLDVLSELEICCHNLEVFVIESGEGLTWCVSVRWLARIIYVCDDLLVRNKSKSSTHLRTTSIENMLLSTRASCYNILNAMKKDHPFTALIVSKYLEDGKD